MKRRHLLLMVTVLYSLTFVLSYTYLSRTYPMPEPPGPLKPYAWFDGICCAPDVELYKYPNLSGGYSYFKLHNIEELIDDLEAIETNICVDTDAKGERYITRTDVGGVPYDTTAGLPLCEDARKGEGQ